MSTLLINRHLDAELGEARARYAARRPRSKAAHDDAAQVMPGGNTRSVLFHGPFPLRIVKGEGAVITDADGNAYVNMLGEYTAGIFGHSHPAIRKAIDQALDGGVNLGAHNRFEAGLAREVVNRFPAIEKVRFTNSGTEANLMAISTARALTGRPKVMVMQGGYHGGLLYFGGAGIPINAPFDYVVAPYNDVEATRALIRAHGPQLACVILEAMLGSGGCIPAETAFLAMIEEETKKAGALFILDEVMTSRFGRGGAHAMHGVTPDLVTLGKWIGGGMSFGAFGGRADLMDAYDPTRPGHIPHAGTFNNNVLTMSAGIAAMREVFTADVAERLHARGDRLRGDLEALFARTGAPLQMKGVGSLMTLQATRSIIRTPEDLAASDDRIKELVFLDLLERGYYMARRGFVALTLALDEAQMDGFVAAMADVIAERGAVMGESARAA